MAKPYESVTESGYIRSLAVVGNPETIARLADLLTEKDVDGQLWSIGNRGDRLYFHITLWERFVAYGLKIAVGYSETSLCPHISYQRTFKEIRVNREKKLFIEKQPVSTEIFLDNAQQRIFKYLVNHPDRKTIQPDTCAVGRFLEYEFIHAGLQDYF